MTPVPRMLEVWSADSLILGRERVRRGLLLSEGSPAGSVRLLWPRLVEAETVVH